MVKNGFAQRCEILKAWSGCIIVQKLRVAGNKNIILILATIYTQRSAPQCFSKKNHRTKTILNRIRSVKRAAWCLIDTIITDKL